MVQDACPHGFLDTSKYSSPLPIIGIYIAAASLICFLATAIDTFRGFRKKNPWFICKYYSLNAATLTILAVATKLPVDLSSSMPSRQDQLTKLTGSTMMCTSMAFFMPSLGGMGSAELLSNLIAISIMAVTMVVNICIQMGTGVIYAFFVEHVIILACILGMLLVLWLSSLSMAINYREMFDLGFLDIARKNPLSKRFVGTRDHLQEVWQLAHVVNPQYALGRSSNCIIVSMLCGVSMVVLLQAIFRSFTLDNSRFCHGASDYGFSTWIVVASQTCAIVTAGVATTIRWFSIAFLASPKRYRTWKDLFEVEEHYLRWLRKLKYQHLLRSHNKFLLSIFWGLKRIMLDLSIVLQKGVVIIGKFMCFSSVWCAFFFKKFLVCLGCIMEWSNGHGSDEELSEPLEILSSILGERDLVPWLLNKCVRDMERWNKKCESSFPNHLIQLLSKWPNAGACVLDDPSSMHLVMIVKIAMLLSSNEERTQLLVNAVNEALGIVCFAEENSGKPLSLRSSKLSPEFWSSRNDPNHWLNEGFQRLSMELDSMNTTEVSEFLEKLITFCKMSAVVFMNRKFYLDVFEVVCLHNIMTSAESKGPFVAIFDLINFLEKTACTLFCDLLKKLPCAIVTEYTQYPMEKLDERVKRAMYFLSKAEKLQDYIEFTWQETRDESAPSDEYRY